MAGKGKKGKTFRANQWQPDPRQALFLQYYIDPNSETFANALRSALRAGYEQEYAENITHLMPDWLSEGIGDAQMVKQALDNLTEFLTMDTLRRTFRVRGGKRTVLEEADDPRLKTIKADISKFVLERLQKKKFASRQEMTGPGGGPIEYTLPQEEMIALDKLIAANQQRRKNDH
jgi:hypothetical protein